MCGYQSPYSTWLLGLSQRDTSPSIDADILILSPVLAAHTFQGRSPKGMQRISTFHPSGGWRYRALSLWLRMHDVDPRRIACVMLNF